MGLNSQEIKVIRDFLDTDLVPLLESECERLPQPYNGVLKSVVGAMLPMLVKFLSDKIQNIGQAQVAGAPVVTAPVTVVAP